LPHGVAATTPSNCLVGNTLHLPPWINLIKPSGWGVAHGVGNKRVASERASSRRGGLIRLSVCPYMPADEVLSGKWHRPNRFGQLFFKIMNPREPVISHGISGKDIPIMARLAKARHWSKQRQACLSSPNLAASQRVMAQRSKYVDVTYYVKILLNPR